MRCFRQTAVCVIPLVVLIVLNCGAEALLFPRSSYHRQINSITCRTMVPDEASSSPSVTRVLSALVLHGSEGGGAQFEYRLESLVTFLKEQGIALELSSVTAPFRKGEGFVWWTLPPGVRSYQAEEYQGFEQSASLVLDTLEKSGPFDLLIGHSQGAILILALLGLKRIKKHPSVGYLLNGVAMPNPYRRELESLRLSQEQSPVPRVLFVLGKNDEINPLAIGDEVKDCAVKARLDTTICYHSGGHSVPVQDAMALDIIVQWIRDGLKECC